MKIPRVFSSELFDRWVSSSFDTRFSSSPKSWFCRSLPIILKDNFKTKS